MPEYYNPETATYYNPESDKRVAVVTGGNGGLGWYTSLHLFLHGYTVYIAGRNPDKVASALSSIQKEAEAREQLYTEQQKRTRFFGVLKSVPLDCADLGSVRRCAAQLRKQEPRIHVLINNAGIMAVPFELTADGFEIQYQVNYLAPVVLTSELLPSLTAAGADALPRVVCLSSIGHRVAFKYFDPACTFHYWPEFLFTWLRYAHAKAGAIEYMRKFARDHTDMLAFSIHPGVIPSTGLFESFRNTPIIGAPQSYLLNLTGKSMIVSEEEGALSALRAAMDDALGPAQSGAYLSVGGAEAAPSAVAASCANIDKTWARTVEMLQEKGYAVGQPESAKGR